MPIDPADYSHSNAAFREQVSVEMQRGTATLNRIATVLRAGLAEPRLLMEFREAVDRVREAGWIVQQSLDAEQGRQISAMLFAHRARAVISLMRNLRHDLPAAAQDSVVPMRELLQSIDGFLDGARACGLLK